MTIELLERPAEASAAPAGMISIAQQIWEEKYRFAPAGGSQESCIDESWTRVARAAAAAEMADVFGMSIDFCQRVG